MNRRIISVLIVFLLLASVAIPAASAETIEDNIREVGNAIKGTVDFAKEVAKEVIEINKKVITDPSMQSVHLKTIAGASVGAVGGGVPGATAGGIISTLEGYGQKIIEEEAR